MTVADRGAHLCEVSVPDGDRRVVVSVDYPNNLAEPKGFHGASVGRYANRIANASFDLDGTPHRLTANEGAHQLHGGPAGFDKADWASDGQVTGDTATITLEHRSPAGDQGFPGEVRALATFVVTKDSLTIEYEATTDAATPINLTNHVYWNLARGHGFEGHSLTVLGDRVVNVDDTMIPLPGPPCSVAGTRFDCRSARSLSELASEGGLDNCFVLDNRVGPGAVIDHESGRRLELSTDQVGLQVYTGLHLRAPLAGVALEPQCLPDTPNRPDFGDCTLAPGERYHATTELRFRW